MRKIKKIIGLVLYHSIAKHLPRSSSPLKFGRIRTFCAKLILTKCGKKVNIEKGAVFSSKITIGNNSGIGVNAYISACHIGDDVMMGPYCTIYESNHKFDRTDIPMREQGFTYYDPVEIGNDVWIGGHVTIMPGVKIGNHCVIGACSVVTKDIPDWGIAVGNPAVVKKFRK